MRSCRLRGPDLHELVDSRSVGEMPPPLPADHAQERALLFILPAVAFAGIGWKALQLPLPACVFFKVSGIPCVTCGISRGSGLLLAGDWLGAAAMNPLTILLPMGLGLLWMICLLRLLGVKVAMSEKVAAMRKGAASVYLRLGIVVLLACVWIYVLARHFLNNGSHL